MTSKQIEKLFQSAETPRRLSKEQYDLREPKLRALLLKIQAAARKAKAPVVIIVSGADGAGKGEFVHRLNEWFDPRGVNTHAFWKWSDEENERPYFWRFWRTLPRRGEIAVLFGSWYTDPIIQRVYGETDDVIMDEEARRITNFETMLAKDGAIFVKLWFHLSKKDQREKMKELEKNPRGHARVLPDDWKHLKLYRKFTRSSQRMMRKTHSALAPWKLINACDARYRDMNSARVILATLKEGLKRNSQKPRGNTIFSSARSLSTSSEDYLAEIDLSSKLSDKEYTSQIAKYQLRLNELSWEANKRGVSSIIVFEGWDAAGKGSAIKRITKGIDPRLYRVVTFAAPTEEEKQFHYLWRFWREIPGAGKTTIYDRSWYGRVLVERIEGFASRLEWTRAYKEIVDFEDQLIAKGIVLTKFWIHISSEEQMRRFEERQKVLIKRHKITDEDWRNREKWNEYEIAVNDMVSRTSTEASPWTLIPGNDKKFARIEILKTVCQNLKRILAGRKQ
jgi:AMP-polyphosphate phosphotransferase